RGQPDRDPRRGRERQRQGAQAGAAVGWPVTVQWRPRSFQDKLTWLVTGTSAVAILVVASVLATANHLNLRRSAFAALDAQVATTALNSGAPLVFGDRETATEVLAALRAMPSVQSATLY